jgi:LysR family glycine cleavage system transcriptional activator
MKTLRDINLNSLRIVESAARNGSFVRAAEEQLLTPSAVSQRVKKLEEQLQFKIFNRRNNAVILTMEGAKFVAHVRDALDTILSAGLEARSYNRENILKISALPTFTIRWLLQRLPDFDTHHEDIRISLSTSYAPVNFAREDFDITIRYGNGRFPGLKSRLLFQEELTPVCAPSLLASAEINRKARPSDLKRFTLLHSDTCTMNWQYWLEQMRAQQVLKQAPSAYFDSCMLSYEAAIAGVGIAIANQMCMLEHIESGKLVAPFSEKLCSGFGWYLVYPEAHSDLSRVEIFSDWIAKQAEKAKTDQARVFGRSD